MPVSVRWDERENQFVHFETSGTWTPEEYHEGLLRLRRIVADANPIPTGILFSPNGLAPTGLFPLLRIGLRFANDMNLPCVIISPPEFSRRFYDVLTKYYPLDTLRFAANLEEAYEILKSSGTS
jgi:hypothetical protein